MSLNILGFFWTAPLSLVNISNTFIFQVSPLVFMTAEISLYLLVWRDTIPRGKVMKETGSKRWQGLNSPKIVILRLTSDKVVCYLIKSYNCKTYLCISKHNKKEEDNLTKSRKWNYQQEDPRQTISSEPFEISTWFTYFVLEIICAIPVDISQGAERNFQYKGILFKVLLLFLQKTRWS